jgi:transcriptional regulator with XRE-family HTH domain
VEIVVANRPPPQVLRRQTRYAAFGPDVRERDHVLLAFSEKLQAQRNATGLTQEAFAVRCFMRRTELSEIERGRRAPDILDLLMLESRLGVQGGKLIDGLEAPVRRVSSAQMCDLITRRPGITTEELATSLGLPSSYVFEIALYLQSAGVIVSRRTGWHAVVEIPRLVEEG